MSKKEIEARIDTLEWEVAREECRERDYDSWKVWELNQEIKTLKKALETATD